VGAGAAVLAITAAAAVFAPALTFHDPHEQFADFPYAPPMRPRIFDDGWRPHLPFVYPIRNIDRLERRYAEDRSTRVPLFLAPEASRRQPVFLLGADALGRDLWSRLLFGARASLGIALAASLGALALGTAAGALAGYAGGFLDDMLMRAAEVVLVLPAIYVVLALRAAMPLVLEPGDVFAGLSIVLALAGWPIVARGVRAIVAAERDRDYAEAARASGASAARVLLVHLLPAARGFVTTQAALLIPAFVLAEATLSFVGFGFAEPVPSWGTMLQDAGTARAFADFPWLLSPAIAIAIVSLAVNAAVSSNYEDLGRVQF
jgi:peptide/nickel transport system permease protein